MRIFGRKANQQSTTPTAPDVPPELQPYYGRPSLGTRLRRVGLFVLPVIAALALIAALIAGGIWLKNRSSENNHKVATSQSTTQKPATNNKQANGGSQNQSGNSSPSQSGGSQPSNSPSTTPNNSSTTNNPSSQQPAASSPSSENTNQAAAQGNIPSTGPDSSIYLLALATAIVGTAAAYARQLKKANR